MKFRRKHCVLIFFVLALFVNQTNQIPNHSPKQVLDEIFLPFASTLLPAFAIPPPAGPIIFAGLGLLQICSNIIGNRKHQETATANVEKTLIKMDLMEVRMALLDQIKTVDIHLLVESERIIRELTMVIESNGIFERMRLTLDFFQRFFKQRMSAVINPKIIGVQKISTIENLLSFESEYRIKLGSFVNEFIKPNAHGLLLLKPKKLFYELILEKEYYLAEQNDDCNSDSLHSKIYKSFVYILKVLTEAYLLPISAHVVRYRKYRIQRRLAESEEIRENAVLLVDEFKNDLKKLIESTIAALDKSPREIRNCGQFAMKEGKTFEHISFCHMVPRVCYFEFVDAFYYKCKHENYVNLTNYDLNMCGAYTNDIPFGSELSIQINIHNGKKHPFTYMDIRKPNGTKEVFGHNKGGITVKNFFKTHSECHTTFCHATQKNSYAISTKLVSAKPGNVITGLRFRVRNKVIYIDIQQGKYIDILTVDPKTVYWTEAPKSDEIVYLGDNVKTIELGNFELKNNSILTSFSLKKSVLRKGMIKVFMNNTDSVSYQDEEFQLNELHLPKADNPVEMENSSTKNIISKPPVPGQRYFVTFQQSDFKKDFGQTTIPFLDIREVVTNPPAPLNGFGFYHQSIKGSGGFISIKLITPKLNDRVDILNG